MLVVVVTFQVSEAVGLADHAGESQRKSRLSHYRRVLV
jgi:hypothetical protein